MSQADFAELVALTGFPFPVYASGGAEPRARALAGRATRGYRFLAAQLGREARLRLLVLGPEDWERHTGSPMYGVPQTVDTETIVVAGQSSELWDMVVPPPERLPAPEAESLRAAYGRADGAIDIAHCMDLLPVHELGHLFVDQAAGAFDFHRPRRWLVELFCNLGLHAYVAAEEPELLPLLETFPRAVAAQEDTSFAHRSLAEFETIYADMEPPNFVWYLSRLHLAAKRVYDAGGAAALRRLYELIAGSTGELPDEQLAIRLRADVHPEVERVLSAWPA